MTKNKIVILSLVLVVVSCYKYYQVYNKKFNYLYQGSVDLSFHSISQKKTSQQSGIVFLGNSPVSGNNVPAKSTTSDYLNRLTKEEVYNLGRMEQGLTESLAYLDHATSHKPRLILVGLNPRSFNLGIKEEGLLATSSETLKQYGLITESQMREADLIHQISSFAKGAPPSSYQLSFRSFFYRLRFHFYGPLYSKRIRGKIKDRLEHLLDGKIIEKQLNAIISYCKDNSLELAFYHVPIHNLREVYNPNEFSQFLSSITEFLGKNNTPFFNFSNSLESDSEHFTDFIHRTPLGNQEFATLLKKSLEEYDLL